MAVFAHPEATETAFYRAFEQGDLEGMMAVWAPSSDIRCIHPLGGLLTGVAAIRASWNAIFRAQLPQRFEIERLSVFHADELVIHTVTETIVLPLQRQRFAPLLATNAYRRIDGSWHMVLHHASPVGGVETAEVVPFEGGETNATRH